MRWCSDQPTLAGQVLLHSPHGVEDSGGSALDVLQAFHQQPRVTLVELDVVLSGGAGFKADGTANHERDRLGFSFAYELGGARAGRVAYPDPFGPGRIPSQRAPRGANLFECTPFRQSDSQSG